MAKKDLRVDEVQRLYSRTVEGKHRVSRNLYLQVQGRSAAWLYRYQRDHRCHWRGLGAYPAIDVFDARRKAQRCEQMLAEGKDPIETARQSKRILDATSPLRVVTFKECAEQYIASHQDGWSDDHATQWRTSLKNHVYPHFGNVGVNWIDTGLVLKALRPIWQKIPETARRIRARIETVVDAAKAQGLCAGGNPAAWKGNLKHWLSQHPRTEKHHEALPHTEIPALMSELLGRDDAIARAVILTVLTAARANETRFADWSEIDVDARTWTVPASRMKSSRQHIVPLPSAVLELIGPPGTGLIFTSADGQRLGKSAMYDRLTALRPGTTLHGLRSTFRDWCADAGFARELAEAALAHTLGNAAEIAYWRSTMIERRRTLMQAWCDFCLAAPGSNVVPLRA
jgi:integrase